MNFYLCNKDEIIAEFESTRVLKDNKSVFQDFRMIRAKYLPKSWQRGMTIKDWVKQRLIISRRTYMLRLFKIIGIKNLDEIIAITKGISLNDTFWIKEVNDKIKWRDVSPYTNPLNRDIANFSFTSKIPELTHIEPSPDFATSGQFAKCWQRYNGKVYMIKTGSTYGMNKGNEVYSEILADELLNVMQIPHIHYEYIKYKDTDAVKCELMCNEDVGLITLHQAYPNIKSYKELLQMKKDRQQMLGMFLFDYLSMNTDRHFNNIGYFIDNKTQQIKKMTPIYDNNLAFLPYYVPKIDKSIDKFIFDLNRETTSSADGTSFDDLFKMIDCQYVRSLLEKVKGYKFKTKCCRTDIAQEILDRQISKIG